MLGSPISRSSSGRSPLPQGSRVTVALTPRSLVRAPIAAEAVSYGLDSLSTPSSRSSVKGDERRLLLEVEWFDAIVLPRVLTAHPRAEQR
jgi:hypothetical protein